MTLSFIVVCQSDTDCASGATCNAPVCECPSNIPAFVGGEVYESSAVCVECSVDDGSLCAASGGYCDLATSTCMRKSVH